MTHCASRRDTGSIKRHFTGTHRTREPADTLLAFRRFADFCGITRLANLTGLDCIGIPVCAAIRPLARSLVVSLGKGVGVDAAMASALMESIETWHAETVPAAIVNAGAADLRRAGFDVLDPGLLARTLDGPAAAEPHSWIRAEFPLGGGEVLVPFEAVSMDFTIRPGGPGTGILRSSNGLASGNHRDEALVHAICEVIERDAEALWRASADFRRLDLSTVTDPTCSNLIDAITSANMEIAAWDITSDVGIPAYGCLILPASDLPDWATVGVHDGFGCHLSPAVALARAITEAAQTRLTYIAGSRDDVFPDDIRRANDPAIFNQVRQDLTQIPARERFRPEPVPTQSLSDDVAVLAHSLSAVGVRDIICCDLTRPELNIPVVKVLIPGLEGPWEQSNPGDRRRRLAQG